MKKTILELYFLIISFIALIVFAINTGNSLYDFIKITYPKLTLENYTYKQYQSNEAFIANRKKLIKENKETITKTREKKFQIVLELERREGIQSLIRSLIAMMIGITLFLIHWNMRKRLRENNASIS